jgi:transcriptional regulator with XRE-family HTH domain
MNIVKLKLLFYVLKANMGLRDIFVKNLRQYRKEKGITQATLAEHCETSTSYIGQIEIGNRFPSLEMIEKMAETLQIRPYLFFFSEDDENIQTQKPKKKKDSIPDTVKDELIKSLTKAIEKIVKNTH